MGNTVLGILGLGLVLVGFGTLAAAEDEKKEAIQKERALMKGTWKVESLVMDGKKSEDENLPKIRIDFAADGKLKVILDNETIIEATTTIDPTKKPKTIDVTYTKGDLNGKSALGIYKIEKDTITFCRAAPDKDRPKEFSSKEGSGHILLIYKKDKEKKKL